MASYDYEIIARHDGICSGGFDRMFRDQIGNVAAA
jgi:hypothetical protein